MQKDKLNAADITGLISEHSSLSKRVIDDFLKALISTIEEGLLVNDVVKIKGLGTFKLQWNEPRKSVNVNTGEEIVIDGYYKVVFAPEAELRDLVNLPYAHLEATLLSSNDENMPPDPENDFQPDSTPEPMRILTEQASEIKNILSEINSLGKKAAPHNTSEAVSEVVPAANEIADDVAPDDLVLEEVVSPSEQPVPSAPVTEIVSEDVSIAPEKSQESAPAFQPKNKNVKSAASRSFAVVMFVFIGIGIGIGVTYLMHYMNWLPDRALIFQFAEDDSEDIAWFDAADAADNDEINNDDSADELIEEELGNEVVEVVSQPAEVDIVRPDQSAAKVDFNTVASLPRIYDDFIATEEVIPGSRLARIAERHYGVREFWVYIYEANIDLFVSPDYVAPGTTLRIPKLHPLLGDPKSAEALAFAKKLHDQYIKK